MDVQIQIILLDVKEVLIVIIQLGCLILIVVLAVTMLYVLQKLAIHFLYKMQILFMSVCFALIFQTEGIALQICNLIKMSIWQLKKR